MFVPSLRRHKALDELEGIIERGMEGFRTVSDALTEIHDRKLWRRGGYTSFVDYCEKRWGLKQCAAYNYLRAGEVVRSLPEEKASTIGLHQAVVLSRLPAEAREKEARETDFASVSTRSLASRVRQMPSSRNAAMLAQFRVFCQKHPELDFWESLEQWRGFLGSPQVKAG